MKAFSLILISLFAVSDAKAEGSRGHFVLVGGGKMGVEIRREFIRLAGGKDARIVVIPSASSAANPRAAEARWRSYGFKVTVLHATDRRAAADAKLYACLDRATGVWIGGGKQSRLMYLFAGTPLADKLKAVLARNGVIGGTSAGASVVSRVMVVRQSESRGLGLLENCIIDQHFNKRHREKRLKRLVEKHRDKIGYGIDESTALVISGDAIKVVGAGSVRRYRANGGWDKLPR